MKIIVDDQGELRPASTLLDAHGQPMALAAGAGLDRDAHDSLRGEMGAGGGRYFSGYL
jgi:hypothetical protein